MYYMKLEINSLKILTVFSTRHQELILNLSRSKTIILLANVNLNTDQKLI